MAQQILNLGAAPNDDTGDTARAGGSKINANFTELYDRTATIVTPYEYGAVGGGSDDDHAALQAAWNALVTAGGGVLLIPPETFLFNSKLDFQGDNIQIVGQGRSSILKSGVTTGTAVEFNASGGAHLGLNVRDMVFEGGAGEALLVKTTYALDGGFERVIFRNASADAVFAGRPQNTTFNRCEFRDITGNALEVGNDGLGSGGQHCRIILCTFFTINGAFALKLATGAEHRVIASNFELVEGSAAARGIWNCTFRSHLNANVFERCSVNIEEGEAAAARARSTVAVGNVFNGGKLLWTRYASLFYDGTVLIDRAAPGTNWSFEATTDESQSESYFVRPVIDSNTSDVVEDGGVASRVVNNASPGKLVIKDALSWKNVSYRTFTSGDTTPDVAGYDSFRTANAAATTITRFDNLYTGKRFMVVAGDGNTTIANNASIITGTGANVPLVNGDYALFEAREVSGAMVVDLVATSVGGDGIEAHTHPLSDITDAGNMASQNKTAVDIDGGTIDDLTTFDIDTAGIFRTTAGHIRMYETDAADPLDYWSLGKDGDSFLVQLRDNSAGVFIQALQIAATGAANFSNDVDVDGTLSQAGIAVSLAGHLHDDRYYTEAEIDALLAAKADTGHTHTLADVTDSGTMAKQNKGNVDITGGTIAGVSSIDVSGHAYIRNIAGHIRLYETDAADPNDYWTIDKNADSLRILYRDASAAANILALFIDSTGILDFRGPTQTTVGAAGAASALPANPDGYLQVEIGGAAKVIPYYRP